MKGNSKSEYGARRADFVVWEERVFGEVARRFRGTSSFGTVLLCRTDFENPLRLLFPAGLFVLAVEAVILGHGEGAPGGFGHGLGRGLER